MVRSVHIGVFWGEAEPAVSEESHETLLPIGIEHIRAIYDLSYKQVLLFPARRFHAGMVI